MDVAAECRAALVRLYAQIDAAAAKQERWLKSAGERFNRSMGQRYRWAMRRKT